MRLPRPPFPAVQAVLAAMALAHAGHAAALGLGGARGAVFIGRPLQLAIAATVEAGDPDAPCVEADVFQGDARVNPGRVTARWEAGPPGTGTVRVTADVAIEEPVVTLYLRVGCASKVTRRYVLLAEQPVEGQRAVPLVQAAPARPPAQSVPATPMASAAAPAPRGRTAAPAPGSTPAAAPSAPPAVPVAKKEAARKAPASVAARREQARLKLEPVEFDAQTQPLLRGSAALAIAPLEDNPARQQAAALWAALSAGPEAVLRNGERIQALEREVASLRDITRKNTVVLQEARDQIAAARNERESMSRVAMGLGILLLAALALAFWAWRGRSNARGAWWRPRATGPDTEFPSGLFTDDVTPESLPPAVSARKAPPSVPLSGPASVARAAHSAPPADFDLSFTHSVLDKLKGESRAAATSNWMPSQADAGLSRLKAEEVIDVQQQAEFFLSIGQVERALSLLEAHVQQPSQTSALAWLDLLEIYHDQGRRDDYDRVRDAFRAQFKAQVPAFDDYSAGSHGLEKYGRALSRIVSLWPSHRALSVIEESLMRKPGEQADESFDLEAYRELVLLYNIAKEVGEAPVARANAQDSRPGFGATDLVGLSVMTAPAARAAQPPVAAAPERDASAYIPPASSGLGLDIDLFGLEDDVPPTPPAPSKEAADTEGGALPHIDTELPVTAPVPNPPSMLDFVPDWKTTGKKKE